MKFEQTTYPSVLTIAGSDSSGGAGIQADIKTISALSCYAASVITALTAQNTQTVKSIYPINVNFIADQLDAVLSDLSIGAVKIGMLFQPDIIECVADKLSHYQIKNVVLDPVMISKSGCKLITDDAIDALKKYLFPIATVVTPNLDEANVLLNSMINTRDKMQNAAREISEKWNTSVLVKGGHAQEKNCADVLYHNQEFSWFESERINTKNTHGTGCTFSSAIAAYLARDYDLFSAIQNEKKYLTSAIVQGSHLQIGQGHGPVHHFHEIFKL